MSTRDADFRAVTFNGAPLLYWSGSGMLFAANETARLICERRAAGEDPAAIASALAAAFDVPRETALEDVRRFLDELLQLDRCAPPTPDPRTGISLRRTGSSLPEGCSPSSSPHCLRIALAGRQVEVRLPDAESVAAIAPLLAHLASAVGERDVSPIEVFRNGRDYLVSACDGGYRRAAGLDEAAVCCLGELVERACAGRDLACTLHAGAVGCEGRAIILAGACGAGKSTLAAALQTEGFAFLCDDTVPIERLSGRLVPLPIPQALKAGSWPILAPLRPALLAAPVRAPFGRPVRWLAPEGGGPGDWDRTWPVGALVFVRYRPGAGGVPQPVAGVEVVRQVLACGALAGEDVGDLTGWLERCAVWSLEYDDVRAATAGLRLCCSAKNGSQQQVSTQQGETG